MNLKMQKSGFTLIEVMVAMAIFVIFLGVLIGSYSGIVRGQNDANEYRILYSEARAVFEKISSNLRNSYFVYGKEINYLAGVDGFTLFSLSGQDFLSYKLSNGNILVLEGEKQYQLNSDFVHLKSFKAYATPNKNPYNTSGNFDVDTQPKVTIVAEFERTLPRGENYDLTLQTTVSSRWYGTTPETDYVPVFNTNNFVIQ